MIEGTLESKFQTGMVIATHAIALGVLGEKEIGLAALLGRRVGVALDKTNQRDDWSARPLSPAQTVYAAADVVFLPALVSSLRADLDRSGRLEWHREECERLLVDRLDRIGLLSALFVHPGPPEHPAAGLYAPDQASEMRANVIPNGPEKPTIARLQDLATQLPLHDPLKLQHQPLERVRLGLLKLRGLGPQRFYDSLIGTAK